MADWNPEKYLSFAHERARPAMDLIARLPNRLPKLVHDVGCGPGNSTALLRQAFPHARITAIDSSFAMIEKARASVRDADFTVADVSGWTPDTDADIVFSNALFQWVPDHAAQLIRILAALKSGAVLAVQVPDNLAEPSHRLMAEVARPFVEKADSNQALGARTSLLTAAGYFDLFAPHAAHVDVWRTTYHHRLGSHRDIADFLSTTGLRPWLEAIDPQYTDEFMGAYVKAIASHYPAGQDGSVVYPFPRLFIMAVRA